MSKNQFLEKIGQYYELEIVELLRIKEFDPELEQNYDFLRKIQIIKVNLALNDSQKIEIHNF